MKIINTKDEGITLIVLVITIIILLILLSVIINQVLGEKGIFNLAEKATEKYNNAIKQEEALFGDNEKLIDRIAEGISETKTTDETNNTSTPDLPIVTVTTSDYGKKVNEYKATGWSGDWRVFYKDDNYVFLISNSPTINDYESRLHQSTTANTDSYIWKNYMTLFNPFNNSYPFHCISAYLADTQNWTNYLDKNRKS